MRLYILKNYIGVYLPCTVEICLQLISLPQGNLFLMIGSLKVIHKLIFTISSVIQSTSINSRFNLGEP